MNNASPPRPLRVLLAWPEPAATTLWRALQPFHPHADVTRTPMAEVHRFLRDAGYFHVLHIELADWRELTVQQRRRLAARVCLIMLGPDSAAPGDLDGAASCVYLPAVTTAEEGIALLATLHGLLAQEWSVTEIIAKSGGRLALAGGEPSWPAATSERPSRNAALDSAAPGRAVNVVDASGGAVAIGPDTKATNVAAGGTYIEHQIVTSGSDVVIGQIVVLGDAVSGDKVVHRAAGDQININRGVPAASKLEQSAGGDQVNINRGGGAPAAKRCTQCGQPVQADGQFCQNCGAPL